MNVAPRFEKTGENTYTVQVTSSSATVSVGQDEDEAALYTVKFVNAAGDTVSETQYEEGTKAGNITVPENTESYTEGSKVYTYSWGEISDVTADTVYNEIETVTEKKTAGLEITNITQNNGEGTQLSFEFALTGENGSAIADASGVKIFVDGAATFGTVDGSTFVGKRTISAGTHTVYAVFENDDYSAVQSESVTVNLTKAAKPGLTLTKPDVNAGGVGEVTIESDYNNFAYYRSGETTEKTVEGKVITGLRGSDDSHVSAEYYVYAVAHRVGGEADYNFVTASDKAKIIVTNTTLDESKTTETKITDVSLNSDGTAVLVTVSVTDENGAAADGTVSFNGETETLENGEAVFELSSLGENTFTASFGGNEQYKSSESEAVNPLLDNSCFLR